MMAALLVMVSLAQRETITETKNGFTVTFPVGFTMDSNSPTSFSLTAEDGTQVNFATAAELESSFGLTPSDAEEAFTQMIDAVVSVLGATKAEDGALRELTINGVPAPVQKVNAPQDGSSFYFGIMTLEDGTWGLIGFTSNYDTQPALLEAIYNTVEVAPSDGMAEIAMMGSALRPSQMPVGKGILFSSRGNIVFSVPDGLQPTSDDPVFESVVYQSNNLNSVFSVMTVDVSFADSLDAFLESYIKVLAEAGGHTDFVFAEHVAKSAEANGATSYLYNSALHTPENSPAIVLVAVKGLEDTYGVLVQVTGGMSDRKMLEDSAREIFETLVLVPRSADAVAVPDAEGASADSIDCYTVAYMLVGEDTPEKTVTCPAGCIADNKGTVWGTDIYTNDSSVCAAAVHAGVISSSTGGLVVVTKADGQESYVGSDRNGISTLSYSAWGGSFTVSKP